MLSAVKIDIRATRRALEIFLASKFGCLLMFDVSSSEDDEEKK